MNSEWGQGGLCDNTICRRTHNLEPHIPPRGHWEGYPY